MSFARVATVELEPVVASPSPDGPYDRLNSASPPALKTQLQNGSNGTVAAVASSDTAVPTAASISADTQPFSFTSLLLLFAVVVADGVALHIIVPFIGPMCSERFGISPQAVGAAAGLLLGSFSMAVLLSSFVLGHLSDLYGRKKFMLLGLATSVFCPILFGVSTSFGLALFTRILSGITNANLVLTKTVISDIPSSRMSPERRALAYAYLGGTFQLSRAAASALAGVTTGVNVGSYDNPYFLPCLLAGIFNLLTLVFTAYMLPETLTVTRKRAASRARSLSSPQPPRIQHMVVAASPSTSTSEASASPPSQHSLADEDAPGRKEKQHRKYERVLDDAGVDADEEPTAESVDLESGDLGVPREDEAVGSNGANGVNSSKDMETVALGVETSSTEEDDHSGCMGTCRFVWHQLVLGLRLVWADLLLRKLIVLQCIHAFANGSFMLLLSLFAALALEYRGMGMSPAQVGGCYTLFGMVSLCFQLLVYKRLHKKLGLYRLYLCGTLLLGIAAALMPLSGVIKSWEVSRLVPEGADASSVPITKFWISWTYLVVTLVGMACGFMVCLPVVGAMMSYAVQGSSSKGLALGVSQSLMSGFRGLGAAIMGALFSWVAHHTRFPALVFGMLATLNLSCFAIAWRMNSAERYVVSGDAEKASTNAANGTSRVPISATDTTADDRPAEPSMQSHHAASQHEHSNLSLELEGGDEDQLELSAGRHDEDDDAAALELGEALETSTASANGRERAHSG